MLVYNYPTHFDRQFDSRLVPQIAEFLPVQRFSVYFHLLCFKKRERSMSLNAMANKALLGPVNFIYCRNDKPSFNTGVL